MSPEHQQWIDQATELARAKKYDQARELALQVLREDGRNTRALWIVASVTASLTERRNALNALLRLQPDNLHARHMLNSMNEEASKSTKVAAQAAAVAQTSTSSASNTQTHSVIHSLSTPNTTQPVILYAILASLVLIVVATIFAGFIF